MDGCMSSTTILVVYAVRGCRSGNEMMSGAKILAAGRSDFGQVGGDNWRASEEKEKVGDSGAWLSEGRGLRCSLCFS